MHVETPAREMTVKQIGDELDVLAEMSRDRGEHGGSPGEWMIERMDELEMELKRRQKLGIAS